METTKYSADRPAGREHIPLYPKGFIAVRIVQLVFAVIILGLSGFGVAGYAFDGVVFILVVALMTLITSIYHLVAEYGAPGIYNYWAALSLDILLIIMWLSSFALLASEVAYLMTYSYSSYSSYSYYYYDVSYSIYHAWSSCLAAASALGAVEFILHIISLSIHSVMLHRHRKVGLHCQPGVPRTMPGAAAEKVQPQPVAVQQAAPVPTPMYAPPAAAAFPQQQVMTPPPQQMYAAPQPFYPQQTPSPLVAQQTGSSYAPPVMQGQMPEMPTAQQQAYQPVVYQHTQ